MPEVDAGIEAAKQAAFEAAEMEKAEEAKEAAAAETKMLEKTEIQKAVEKAQAEEATRKIEGVTVAQKLRYFAGELEFALKQCKHRIGRKMQMLKLPLAFNITTMIGVDTKACSPELAAEIKEYFKHNSIAVDEPVTPVKDEPSQPSQEPEIDKH